jgi:cell division protein FtsN
MVDLQRVRMKQQRGGTFLGFIIGVVVGLGAGLAVAMYVNKVPIPFVNKGQSRSTDQDAAEILKNKGWDPNAPLYGKNPARPAPVLSAPTASDLPATPAPSAAKAEVKPAVSADPLGDLAKARAGVQAPDGPPAGPISYFVQVGAFRTPEDAESQRAKLSLAGVEARVTEREQAGRTVYRVRVGPFDHKEDADRTKEKLDAAGVETALVRVQR